MFFLSQHSQIFSLPRPTNEESLQPLRQTPSPLQGDHDEVRSREEPNPEEGEEKPGEVG